MATTSTMAATTSTTATTSTSRKPDICEPGGEGLWLPLFPNENNWPDGFRVIIYFLGLGWLFLGVAIVSDVFMGSIAKITSKKARKLNLVTRRYITTHVWNPTVANLSLMALGSSAPEILLSIIELFKNNMLAGELGPSTIVGSAAFNLLMIVAVCVSSIPEGEVRFIKEIPVYLVTAVFSIFAYVWLAFILVVTSPHVVHPVEGIVTFLYFPLLIALAYLADVGFFSKNQEPYSVGTGRILDSDMSKEELAELEAQIRRDFGGQITEEQLKRVIASQAGVMLKTRATYRIGATRAIVGGKRVHIERFQRAMTGMTRHLGNSGRTSGKDPLANSHRIVPVTPGEETQSESAAKPVFFGFAVLKYAVLENAGSVTLIVCRTGEENALARVGYRTREGTAKKEQDFAHTEGFLTFEKGEKEKKVTVTIVDDTAYEDDEEFYVDLYDPVVLDASDTEIKAELGERKTVTVVIIDDDLPGVIGFAEDTVKVEEKPADQIVNLVVNRNHGCTGKVTCKYYTEDDTAIAPTDYEKLSGTLTFDVGETAASIKCLVKAKGRYERIECFRLILVEPTGGAKFDPNSDGGEDSCILTIMIRPEQIAKDRIDRIMSNMQLNWDKAKIGTSNWREQFINALYVNGGEDEDEEEGQAPMVMDYIMHIVTFPWKVFFAFVPPTDYCGGWACFVCSLGAIGIVTAMIGDLAALLGCTIGLWPPEVTAITFVALGTSLPDTFASKSAAQQDPYADASVGNVTGSNSVNVFLGLGLPWMIGSLYWTFRRPNADWTDSYSADPQLLAEYTTWPPEYAVFVVKGGAIVPSVCIFACCAITCIFILYVRRRMFEGELGGPKKWALATSVLLGLLWVFYVCLASYYALQEKSRRDR